MAHRRPPLHAENPQDASQRALHGSSPSRRSPHGNAAPSPDQLIRSEDVVTLPDSQTRQRKRSIAIILIILAVLLLAAVGYLGFSLHQGRISQETDIPEAGLPVSDIAGSDLMAQNPIDFAALQAENPEIYAWIRIPNTLIDYPVLQSAADDSFYLYHDRTGAFSYEGSIYSEACNSKDFTDPVTLLYGHTYIGNDDIYFGTLHYFENPDFFDANEAMYIYTPDRILTYRIIAAYIFDDRHIMKSFDFTDPHVVQTYFNFAANPTVALKNVRDGVSLDGATDRIVQMSTCTTDHVSTQRFIVTAQLVIERKTS